MKRRTMATKTSPKSRIQLFEYEGYLVKKGTGVFAKWQERYFVIQNDWIHYYESKPLAYGYSSPSGSISLVGARVEVFGDHYLVPATGTAAPSKQTVPSKSATDAHNSSPNEAPVSTTHPVTSDESRSEPAAKSSTPGATGSAFTELLPPHIPTLYGIANILPQLSVTDPCAHGLLRRANVPDPAPLISEIELAAGGDDSNARSRWPNERPFTFAVHTQSARVHILCAPSLEVREKWISQILRAITLYTVPILPSMSLGLPLAFLPTKQRQRIAAGLGDPLVRPLIEHLVRNERMSLYPGEAVVMFVRIGGSGGGGGRTTRPAAAAPSVAASAMSLLNSSGVDVHPFTGADVPAATESSDVKKAKVWCRDMILLTTKRIIRIVRGIIIEEMLLNELLDVITTPILADEDHKHFALVLLRNSDEQHMMIYLEQSWAANVLAYLLKCWVHRRHAASPRSPVWNVALAWGASGPGTITPLGAASSTHSVPPSAELAETSGFAGLAMHLRHARSKYLRVDDYLTLPFHRVVAFAPHSSPLFLETRMAGRNAMHPGANLIQPSYTEALAPVGDYATLSFASAIASRNQAQISNGLHAIFFTLRHLCCSIRKASQCAEWKGTQASLATLNLVDRAERHLDAVEAAAAQRHLQWKQSQSATSTAASAPAAKQGEHRLSSQERLHLAELTKFLSTLFWCHFGTLDEEGDQTESSSGDIGCNEGKEDVPPSDPLNECTIDLPCSQVELDKEVRYIYGYLCDMLASEPTAQYLTLKGLSDSTKSAKECGELDDFLPGQGARGRICACLPPSPASPAATQVSPHFAHQPICPLHAHQVGDDSQDISPPFDPHMPAPAYYPNGIADIVLSDYAPRSGQYWIWNSKVGRLQGLGAIQVANDHGNDSLAYLERMVNLEREKTQLMKRGKLPWLRSSTDTPSSYNSSSEGMEGIRLINRFEDWLERDMARTTLSGEAGEALELGESDGDDDSQTSSSDSEPVSDADVRQASSSPTSAEASVQDPSYLLYTLGATQPGEVDSPSSSTLESNTRPSSSPGKQAGTLKISRQVIDSELMQPSVDGTIHGIPVSNDERVYSIWENQRFYVFYGWSEKTFPTERPSWSDPLGLYAIRKDEVKLPSGWRWATEWKVDIDPDRTDLQGWSYAVRFTDDELGYTNKHRFGQFVRRRRWSRRALRTVATKRYQITDTTVSDSTNSAREDPSKDAYEVPFADVVSLTPFSCNLSLLAPRRVIPILDCQSVTRAQLLNAPNQSRLHFDADITKFGVTQERTSVPNQSVHAFEYDPRPGDPLIGYVRVFEEQKKAGPLGKFSTSRWLLTPSAEDDSDLCAHRDSVRPPIGWEWAGDWAVFRPRDAVMLSHGLSDIHAPDENLNLGDPVCDEEGWVYGSSQSNIIARSSDKAPVKGGILGMVFSVVRFRRRCWIRPIRRALMLGTGPACQALSSRPQSTANSQQVVTSPSPSTSASVPIVGAAAVAQIMSDIPSYPDWFASLQWQVSPLSGLITAQRTSLKVLEKRRARQLKRLEQWQKLNFNAEQLAEKVEEEAKELHEDSDPEESSQEKSTSRFTVLKLPLDGSNQDNAIIAYTKSAHAKLGTFSLAGMAGILMEQLHIRPNDIHPALLRIVDKAKIMAKAAQVARSQLLLASTSSSLEAARKASKLRPNASERQKVRDLADPATTVLLGVIDALSVSRLDALSIIRPKGTPIQGALHTLAILTPAGTRICVCGQPMCSASQTTDGTLCVVASACTPSNFAEELLQILPLTPPDIKELAGLKEADERRAEIYERLRTLASRAYFAALNASGASQESVTERRISAIRGMGVSLFERTVMPNEALLCEQTMTRSLVVEHQSLALQSVLEAARADAGLHALAQRLKTTGDALGQPSLGNIFRLTPLPYSIADSDSQYRVRKRLERPPLPKDGAYVSSTHIQPAEHANVHRFVALNELETYLATTVNPILSEVSDVLAEAAEFSDSLQRAFQGDKDRAVPQEVLPFQVIAAPAQQALAILVKRKTHPGSLTNQRFAAFIRNRKPTLIPIADLRFTPIYQRRPEETTLNLQTGFRAFSVWRPTVASQAARTTPTTRRYVFFGDIMHASPLSPTVVQIAASAGFAKQLVDAKLMLDSVLRASGTSSFPRGLGQQPVNKAPPFEVLWRAGMLSPTAMMALDDWDPVNPSTCLFAPPISFRLVWFEHTGPLPSHLATGELSNSLHHEDEAVNNQPDSTATVAEVGSTEQTRAKGLYLWMPIPHSRDYFALGLIATTTPSPPRIDIDDESGSDISISNLRCVHKSLLVTAPAQPAVVAASAEPAAPSVLNQLPDGCSTTASDTRLGRIYPPASFPIPVQSAVLRLKPAPALLTTPLTLITAQHPVELHRHGVWLDPDVANDLKSRFKPKTDKKVGDATVASEADKAGAGSKTDNSHDLQPPVFIKTPVSPAYLASNADALHLASLWSVPGSGTAVIGVAGTTYFLGSTHTQPVESEANVVDMARGQDVLMHAPPPLYARFNLQFFIPPIHIALKTITAANVVLSLLKRILNVYSAVQAAQRARARQYHYELRKRGAAYSSVLALVRRRLRREYYLWEKRVERRKELEQLRKNAAARQQQGMKSRVDVVYGVKSRGRTGSMVRPGPLGSISKIKEEPENVHSDSSLSDLDSSDVEGGVGRERRATVVSPSNVSQQDRAPTVASVEDEDEIDLSEEDVHTSDFQSGEDLDMDGFYEEADFDDSVELSLNDVQADLAGLTPEPVNQLRPGDTTTTSSATVGTAMQDASAALSSPQTEDTVSIAERTPGQTLEEGSEAKVIEARAEEAEKSDGDMEELPLVQEAKQRLQDGEISHDEYMKIRAIALRQFRRKSQTNERKGGLTLSSSQQHASTQGLGAHADSSPTLSTIPNRNEGVKSAAETSTKPNNSPQVSVSSSLEDSQTESEASELLSDISTDLEDSGNEDEAEPPTPAATPNNPPVPDTQASDRSSKKSSLLKRAVAKSLAQRRMFELEQRRLAMEAWGPLPKPDQLRAFFSPDDPEKFDFARIATLVRTANRLLAALRSIRSEFVGVAAAGVINVDTPSDQTDDPQLTLWKYILETECSLSGVLEGCISQLKCIIFQSVETQLWRPSQTTTAALHAAVLGETASDKPRGSVVNIFTRTALPFVAHGDVALKTLVLTELEDEPAVATSSPEAMSNVDTRRQQSVSSTGAFAPAMGKLSSSQFLPDTSVFSEPSIVNADRQRSMMSSVTSASGVGNNGRRTVLARFLQRACNPTGESNEVAGIGLEHRTSVRSSLTSTKSPERQSDAKEMNLILAGYPLRIAVPSQLKAGRPTLGKTTLGRRRTQPSTSPMGMFSVGQSRIELVTKETSRLRSRLSRMERSVTSQVLTLRPSFSLSGTSTPVTSTNGQLNSLEVISISEKPAASLKSDEGSRISRSVLSNLARDHQEYSIERPVSRVQSSTGSVTKDRASRSRVMVVRTGIVQNPIALSKLLTSDALPSSAELEAALPRIAKPGRDASSHLWSQYAVAHRLLGGRCSTVPSDAFAPTRTATDISPEKYAGESTKEQGFDADQEISAAQHLQDLLAHSVAILPLLPLLGPLTPSDVAAFEAIQRAEEPIGEAVAIRAQELALELATKTQATGAPGTHGESATSSSAQASWTPSSAQAKKSSFGPSPFNVGSIHPLPDMLVCGSHWLMPKARGRAQPSSSGPGQPKNVPDDVASQRDATETGALPTMDDILQNRIANYIALRIQGAIAAAQRNAKFTTKMCAISMMTTAASTITKDQVVGQVRLPPQLTARLRAGLTALSDVALDLVAAHLQLKPTPAGAELCLSALADHALQNARIRLANARRQLLEIQAKRSEVSMRAREASMDSPIAAPSLKAALEERLQSESVLTVIEGELGRDEDKANQEVRTMQRIVTELARLTGQRRHVRTPLEEDRAVAGAALALWITEAYHARITEQFVCALSGSDTDLSKAPSQDLIGCAMWNSVYEQLLVKVMENWDFSSSLPQIPPLPSFSSHTSVGNQSLHTSMSSLGEQFSSDKLMNSNGSPGTFGINRITTGSFVIPRALHSDSTAPTGRLSALSAVREALKGTASVTPLRVEDYDGWYTDSIHPGELAGRVWLARGKLILHAHTFRAAQRCHAFLLRQFSSHAKLPMWTRRAPLPREGKHRLADAFTPGAALTVRALAHAPWFYVPWRKIPLPDARMVLGDEVALAQKENKCVEYEELVACWTHDTANYSTNEQDPTSDAEGSATGALYLPLRWSVLHASDDVLHWLDAVAADSLARSSGHARKIAIRMSLLIREKEAASKTAQSRHNTSRTPSTTAHAYGSGAFANSTTVIFDTSTSATETPHYPHKILGRNITESDAGPSVLSDDADKTKHRFVPLSSLTAEPYRGPQSTNQKGDIVAAKSKGDGSATKERDTLAKSKGFSFASLLTRLRQKFTRDKEEEQEKEREKEGLRKGKIEPGRVTTKGSKQSYSNYQEAPPLDPSVADSQGVLSRGDRFNLRIWNQQQSYADNTSNRPTTVNSGSILRFVPPATQHAQPRGPPALAIAAPLGDRTTSLLQGRPFAKAGQSGRPSRARDNHYQLKPHDALSVLALTVTRPATGQVWLSLPHRCKKRIITERSDGTKVAVADGSGPMRTTISSDVVWALGLDAAYEQSARARAFARAVFSQRQNSIESKPTSGSDFSVRKAESRTSDGTEDDSELSAISEGSELSDLSEMDEDSDTSLISELGGADESDQDVTDYLDFVEDVIDYSDDDNDNDESDDDDGDKNEDDSGDSSGTRAAATEIGEAREQSLVDTLWTWTFMQGRVVRRRLKVQHSVYGATASRRRRRTGRQLLDIFALSRRVVTETQFISMTFTEAYIAKREKRLYAWAHDLALEQLTGKSTVFEAGDVSTSDATYYPSTVFSRSLIKFLDEIFIESYTRHRLTCAALGKVVEMLAGVAGCLFNSLSSYITETDPRFERTFDASFVPESMYDTLESLDDTTKGSKSAVREMMRRKEAIRLELEKRQRRAKKSEALYEKEMIKLYQRNTLLPVSESLPQLATSLLSADSVAPLGVPVESIQQTFESLRRTLRWRNNTAIPQKSLIEIDRMVALEVGATSAAEDVLRLDRCNPSISAEIRLGARARALLAHLLTSSTTPVPQSLPLPFRVLPAATAPGLDVRMRAKPSEASEHTPTQNRSQIGSTGIDPVVIAAEGVGDIVQLIRALVDESIPLGQLIRLVIRLAAQASPRKESRSNNVELISEPELRAAGVVMVKDLQAATLLSTLQDASSSMMLPSRNDSEKEIASRGVLYGLEAPIARAVLLFSSLMDPRSAGSKAVASLANTLASYRARLAAPSPASTPNDELVSRMLQALQYLGSKLPTLALQSGLTLVTSPSKHARFYSHNPNSILTLALLGYMAAQYSKQQRGAPVALPAATQAIEALLFQLRNRPISAIHIAPSIYWKPTEVGLQMIPFPGGPQHVEFLLGQINGTSGTLAAILSLTHVQLVALATPPSTNMPEIFPRKRILPIYAQLIGSSIVLPHAVLSLLLRTRFGQAAMNVSTGAASIDGDSSASSESIQSAFKVVEAKLHQLNRAAHIGTGSDLGNRAFSYLGTYERARAQIASAAVTTAQRCGLHLCHSATMLAYVCIARLADACIRFASPQAHALFTSRWCVADGHTKLMGDYIARLDLWLGRYLPLIRSPAARYGLALMVLRSAVAQWRAELVGRTKHYPTVVERYIRQEYLDLAREIAEAKREASSAVSVVGAVVSNVDMNQLSESRTEQKGTLLDASTSAAADVPGFNSPNLAAIATAVAGAATSAALQVCSPELWLRRTGQANLWAGPTSTDSALGAGDSLGRAPSALEQITALTGPRRSNALLTIDSDVAMASALQTSLRPTQLQRTAELLKQPTLVCALDGVVVGDVEQLRQGHGQDKGSEGLAGIASDVDAGVAALLLEAENLERAHIAADDQNPSKLRPKAGTSTAQLTEKANAAVSTLKMKQSKRGLLGRVISKVNKVLGRRPPGSELLAAQLAAKARQGATVKQDESTTLEMQQLETMWSVEYDYGEGSDADDDKLGENASGGDLNLSEGLRLTEYLGEPSKQLQALNEPFDTLWNAQTKSSQQAWTPLMIKASSAELNDGFTSNDEAGMTSSFAQVLAETYPLTVTATPDLGQRLRCNVEALYTFFVNRLKWDSMSLRKAWTADVNAAIIPIRNLASLVDAAPQDILGLVQGRSDNSVNSGLPRSPLAFVRDVVLPCLDSHLVEGTISACTSLAEVPILPSEAFHVPSSTSRSHKTTLLSSLRTSTHSQNKLRAFLDELYSSDSMAPLEINGPNMEDSSLHAICPSALATRFEPLRIKMLSWISCQATAEDLIRSLFAMRAGSTNADSVAGTSAHDNTKHWLNMVSSVAQSFKQVSNGEQFDDQTTDASCPPAPSSSVNQSSDRFESLAALLAELRPEHHPATPVQSNLDQLPLIVQVETEILQIVHALTHPPSL